MSFSHFPIATWFFGSSSLIISTGLFEKIVSLYGKTLYSPSEEGIMMNGPSVGFHLKKSAEHSSLAYTDSLNFSWVSISSLRSTSPSTGGFRNSLVC